MMGVKTMASVPSSSSRQTLTPDLPDPDRKPRTPLVRWSTGLIVALAITGAYLAGPARFQMDGRAATVLLLHAAVGLLSVPVLVWATVRYGIFRRAAASVLGETAWVAVCFQRAGWLLLPL